MSDVCVDDEVSVKDGQDARAFLRERFIRAVMFMNGKPGIFNMYENTTVSAVFGSCDREFSGIHVKNLETPIGSLADAILRGNDVISIQFHDINPS